ncbi:MAG: winged helix-turn-helix domain-containing protein [Ilumatobacteraceae bacterium]
MNAERVKLSVGQARRMAVAAQGLAEPRPSGRIDRRHLRKVFARIGVIQIDSVNVLVRSQELPLFARLGPYSRNLLPDALADGELFEYWAHMAAIIPSEQHRLFRWKMAQTHHWRAMDRLARDRPTFVEEVFDRISADGPLTAADLEQRIGPKGPWWDWDDGKIALEELFHRGRVVGRRRSSDFARLYDLPERVLPASALGGPTPAEPEARKELLEIAARALGVATLEDLTDYHRQGNQPCRPLVAELIEEGRLLPAEVDGWTRPSFVHVDAKVPRRIETRALLSPFDSLVWNRARNERLFDFHYRIEIYVPAPKRVHGYYVLPFLVDDELVGRVDLKADRANGVLRVHGAFAEPGVPEARVAAELAAELKDMAGWLGLDAVTTTDRGELAAGLLKAGVTAADGLEIRGG